MIGWRRRDLLLAAGAWLAGCGPRARPDPAGPLPDTLRLGWRWSPGMVRAWRTTLTDTSGGRVAETREVWRYLATEWTAGGVARLEATLRGLGGTLAIDGVPVDGPARDAVKQPGGRDPVTVDLRMSGRIAACSATAFAAALPHRLLGMHLPSDPVAIGATWSDSGLMRPFADVLPMDRPADVLGQTTLDALDTSSRPPRARLSHRGTLRLDGVLLVEVSGTTTWDVDDGRILSRRLTARLPGPPGRTLDLAVDALQTP